MPRQNDGRPSRGPSAERHLGRGHVRQACSPSSGLGHAACPWPAYRSVVAVFGCRRDGKCGAADRSPRVRMTMFSIWRSANTALGGGPTDYLGIVW